MNTSPLNIPALGQPLSRRRALATFAHGFGLAALAGLFNEEASAAANPLAARAGHHPARAKRVILLWMNGGPSQVDTFDPKPKLTELHGKEIPLKLPPHMRDAGKKIIGSPFAFAPHGQSGIPISELFPQTAKHADDLCVIRSMKADNIDHTSATMQMLTGEQTNPRPSLGSWLLYGLGTENQNLPGFFVISPGKDAHVWPSMSGSSFLPALYEGTPIRDLARPLANIKNPRLSPAEQRRHLDVLQQLNALHRAGREEDSRLEARIASFETAFRMQADAADALDISRESPETRKLYGLDDKVTEQYGSECLMARRLVERGVRFVLVNHYSKAKGQDRWDQHGDLEKGHRANAAEVDTPIAALLTDLKARGLLKDTLVIWGGEFGRSPTGQGSNGREHHPHGFSMWMAGGGVKGGHIHGATDEFGWYAVNDVVHVHDLHATVLHLMGLDHERLTWRHAGRDYRLTDVFGNVVKGILA